MMWDVIVVGARCAGATIALRFARSGRSVLMLDKVTPASHVLSTHILVTPALMSLDSLGLLESVEATGAPPMHTLLQESDGDAYAISLAYEKYTHHLCVRRSTLDPLLANAARDAGVTLRYGARVTELLWEAGRVVGVRTREKDGSTREERAVGDWGRRAALGRGTAGQGGRIQQGSLRFRRLLCLFGGCRPNPRGRGCAAFRVRHWL